MVTTRSEIRGRYRDGGIACHNESFKCRDGRCLPPTWRCDGDFDCLDKDDEEGCAVAEKCSSTEFRCGTSPKDRYGLGSVSACIPAKWRCDGEFDCEDQSDELNCSNVTCKTGQFTCNEFDGKFKLCIPNTWVCDGQRDCASGADEKNCSLKPKCDDEQFDCGNGVCIFPAWKCDGENDCGNDADELKCDNSSKTKDCDVNTMFKCADDKGCIPKAWKCDGEADCHDRSDETSCEKTLTHCKNPVDFACSSGNTCINKLWKCDGEKDCPDGSDEDDCTEPPDCPSDTKRCKDSKKCITESMKCDGVEDCPGGDDEDNCPSNSTEVTKRCEEGIDFTCPDAPALCVPFDKLCMDATHSCGDPTPCSVDIIQCADKSDACICKTTPKYKKTLCHCDKGYTSVKGKCVDVNECATPGRCDQICKNLPGSYECSCHANYLLSLKPGETIPSRCRAVGADPLVLLSNRAAIRQYDLVTNVYFPLVSSPGSAVAMDFHLNNATLIWSDISTQKIMMCELGTGNTTRAGVIPSKDTCKGGEQTVLVEGDVHTPDGLAVDWVHDLLFWTDGALDTLSVMDLKTKKRRVLFYEDLEEPRAVAVDPQEGLIFWSDWGKEARIERAGMDGEHRRTILKGGFIKWPNGLALDLLDKRLYWADAKVKSIYSSDYYGGDIKVVLHSHSYLRHPFSLAIFEDRVYYTDWEHDGVMSVNKFTGSNVTKLMNSVSTPMTVRIYHKATQPDHPNKCDLNECSESSICLPRATIRTAVASTRVYEELPFSCVCQGNQLINKFACLTAELNPELSSGFSVPVLIIFLILSVSLVGGYVYVRQRRNANSFTALNFDNPVYRRTTEPEMEEAFSIDISREDGEVSFHHSRNQDHFDNNTMIEPLDRPLTT